MKLKYALFDLDGTLTDPGEGIKNSLAFAIGKAGFPVPDRGELGKYIGPPLIPSFMQDYGVSEARSREMLGYFREYFEDRGIFENEVYPGIEALLAELTSAGAKNIVATSKPEIYAEKIVRHFGLDRYFTAVCGNTMEESRTAKKDIIEYVRERFPDISADNAVMVGDRRYDIEGAAQNGLPAIGVLYGYGEINEFSGALHVAVDVGDLRHLLCSLI